MKNVSIGQEETRSELVSNLEFALEPVVIEVEEPPFVIQVGLDKD